MRTDTSPIIALLSGHGTTSVELAKAGVLAPQTLKRLEAGQRVRPTSLRRLADALGVSLDVVVDAAANAVERAVAAGRVAP